MSWNGYKIGGGSQPVKTKYGWLLIYHGVDHSWVYRLGVLLVGLDDPGRLLYRSPNPVLEPEESCELGEEGCYVPNVVFTCGAVPEEDGTLKLYWGGADKVMCAGTAVIDELVELCLNDSREAM